MVAKKKSRTRKTTRKARVPRRRTTTPPNGAARRLQPDAYHTLTPYLAVSHAGQAVDWYKKAFGAKEVSRMPGPGGRLMHAELQIGDSRLLLSDVFPGSDVQDPTRVGNTTTTIHLYTKNIDQVWRKAVAAGAVVTMPLENQFWGDRYGKLRDPFGHSWSLAYPAKMTEKEKRLKQEQAMRMLEEGQHPGMETNARA